MDSSTACKQHRHQTPYFHRAILFTDTTSTPRGCQQAVTLPKGSYDALDVIRPSGFAVMLIYFRPPSGV